MSLGFIFFGEKVRESGQERRSGRDYFIGYLISLLLLLLLQLLLLQSQVLQSILQLPLSQ
jgi:hypothetical protein